MLITQKLNTQEDIRKSLTSFMKESRIQELKGISFADIEPFALELTQKILLRQDKEQRELIVSNWDEVFTLITWQRTNTGFNIQWK